MRGARARTLRRETLPPDLRKQMKEQVSVIAAERADKVGKAAAEYHNAEVKLRAERNKKQGAAVAEFEQRRATIVASFEAKAAERKLASKLVEEAEAA